MSITDINCPQWRKLNSYYNIIIPINVDPPVRALICSQKSYFRVIKKLFGLTTIYQKYFPLSDHSSQILC